jgi:GNAT superfamily N-acetyltransferase
VSGSSTTAFEIRSLDKGDAAVLFEMICALAENEGAREAVTTSPPQIAASGFGDDARWRGLIAERDGEAVGYATYTEDFHIWSNAARLILDDIYVRPEARNCGLGEALMRRIFDIAEDRAAYVSWTVQPENANAVRFYRRLGADFHLTGKCGWRARIK